MITYERANELFRYDPKSGKIYRRVSRGNAKAGDEAGHVVQEAKMRTSYRLIQVDGTQYKAHRLAWLLHHGEWPKHDIDHIDGDGLNNRISNLRDVPVSINRRNSRMQRNNTSGVTGVYWNKKLGKWRAQVRVDGKLKELGCFTDIADAEAIVREFRAKHGFTDRHGEAI